MKQEEAMRFQVLESELSQTQNFIQRIEEQLSEVTNLLESLEEFKKLEIGEEVLFPIANGIFAKGTLADNKKLKLNVGQDVMVDKTIDETVELVNEQLSNLQEQRVAAAGREEDIYRELEEMEKSVKNV